MTPLASSAPPGASPWTLAGLVHERLSSLAARYEAAAEHLDALAAMSGAGSGVERCSEVAAAPVSVPGSWPVPTPDSLLVSVPVSAPLSVSAEVPGRVSSSPGTRVG